MLVFLAGAIIRPSSDWEPGCKLSTAVATRHTHPVKALTNEETKNDIVKILHHDETDPWKMEAYGRIDQVRQKCGSLCSINSLADYAQQGTHSPGNAYSTFTPDVNCTSLFEIEEIDAGDTTVPYPIPEELLDWYSLHGAIDIRYYGRLQHIALEGKKVHVWTKEKIQQDLELLGRGQLKGTYDVHDVNTVRDQIIAKGGLENQKVLVVGSQDPWLEVIALFAGAANVMTLEYAVIESEHPQIATITPGDFRRQYLSGELPQFDSVLTFSSLEHSGLGRYGDALNPWGDILSLARGWCVTKPQGALLLGVPGGPDAIEFNAHRIYGNIRMPLITANWLPANGTKDYEAAGKNALAFYFFEKHGFGTQLDQKNPVPPS